MNWDEAQLGLLRGLAEAAGAAIMTVYARAEFGVTLKADASPLTEADLLADRLISARLPVMFARAPVVSEESPAPPPSVLANGFFLVDPLDGTKEFVARNGEFTVNIAWVEDGRPQAGAVHAPALGETFWGAAGVGAWKADAHGVRRIAVAPAPAAGQALRVLASRSHGGAGQEALLARLVPPPVCVNAGSSLKFCRLAEGAADLYPRVTPTAPWDTAAGQAVLEAAGGVVLEFGGAPLGVPDAPSLVLNPHFVAASSREVAAALMRWYG